MNFVGGLIEDNPLTTLATTLTSAALSALPEVTAPDYVPITLDSDGIAGAPEITYITAHAAGATTATISRGAEGTTARQHAQDIRWTHGPTLEDFITGPDVVNVDLAHPPADHLNWGTRTMNTGYIGGFYRQSTAAQNNYIEYLVPLGVGTWTLDLLVQTASSFGIITVTIDGGSSVGTIDLYSSSGVPVVEKSLPGIVIAAGGLKAVRFTMATKNASSSDYIGLIQGLMRWTRTS